MILYDNVNIDNTFIIINTTHFIVNTLISHSTTEKQLPANATG